jgi:hypothetical protein
MIRFHACLAALLGVMLGFSALAQEGRSNAMLDTLFAKLQTATDPMAVQSLESAIWEQWTMVPDASLRELMMRGIAEMQQHQLKASVETFSKLIELAPQLSEAWNKRATAYWLLGDFTASLSDAVGHLRDGEARAAAFRGLFRARHDPRGNGRIFPRRRRFRAGPQVQSAHRRHRRRDQPAESHGRR